MTRPLGRREFFKVSAAVTTALVGGPAIRAETKKPKLKKAVKLGMVGIDGSYLEKLELVKKCGFLGVEIESPGTKNLDELVKASQETGIAIHGVIDSVHWTDTLSHPSEEIRAKGLKALQGAILDAKAVGADTVLLVPGVVNKDATYEQSYERSQAEVRKALPLAEKMKIKIAIEVVWNMQRLKGQCAYCPAARDRRRDRSSTGRSSYSARLRFMVSSGEVSVRP